MALISKCGSTTQYMKRLFRSGPRAVYKTLKSLSCTQIMCLMMFSCIIILVYTRIKIYNDPNYYVTDGDYVPQNNYPIIPKRFMPIRRSMFVRKRPILETGLAVVKTRSVSQLRQIAPEMKIVEVQENSEIDAKKITKAGVLLTRKKISTISDIPSTNNQTAKNKFLVNKVPKNETKHLENSTTKIASIRSSKNVANVKPAVKTTPFKFPPMKYFSLSINSRCLKPYYLIVYVHTAPLHYSHRMYIRETWGNASSYPDTPIKVVFMVGQTLSPNINDALKLEAERHGDIVMGSYLDSYRNLTYKAVTSLGWVSMACNQTKFVLKVDDDVFVNMFRLMRHLKYLEKRKVNEEKIIMCHLWRGMHVIRDKRSKWFVKKSEYPDDYYTRYCAGAAWVLTQKTVRELFHATTRNGFFWVDDVYVTGILARDIGAKYEKLNSVISLRWPSYVNQIRSKKESNVIFAVSSSFRSWKDLWTLIKEEERTRTERLEKRLKILKMTASATNSRTVPQAAQINRINTSAKSVQHSISHQEKSKHTKSTDLKISATDKT